MLRRGVNHRGFPLGCSSYTPRAWVLVLSGPHAACLKGGRPLVRRVRCKPGFVPTSSELPIELRTGGPGWYRPRTNPITTPYRTTYRHRTGLLPTQHNPVCAPNFSKTKYI